MWFSFDGCDFETHETEEQARKRADGAMDWHSDNAADYGWDDWADQICYGRVTHAVRVERREMTPEEKEDRPEFSCIEYHFLEPVE